MSPSVCRNGAVSIAAWNCAGPLLQTGQKYAIDRSCCPSDSLSVVLSLRQARAFSPPLLRFFACTLPSLPLARSLCPLLPLLLGSSRPLIRPSLVSTAILYPVGRAPLAPRCQRIISSARSLAYLLGRFCFATWTTRCSTRSPMRRMQGLIRTGCHIRDLFLANPFAPSWR